MTRRDATVTSACGSRDSEGLEDAQISGSSADTPAETWGDRSLHAALSVIHHVLSRSMVVWRTRAMAAAGDRPRAHRIRAAVLHGPLTGSSWRQPDGSQGLG